MNRKTKLSLLSKSRELLFQILPDSKGERELRLLCDTISLWVIAGINTNTPTNRHQITNSKELKQYFKSLLDLDISEESIQKVRSQKKNHIRLHKFYKQKF